MQNRPARGQLPIIPVTSLELHVLPRILRLRKVIRLRPIEPLLAEEKGVPLRVNDPVSRFLGLFLDSGYQRHRVSIGTGGLDAVVAVVLAADVDLEAEVVLRGDGGDAFVDVFDVGHLSRGDRVVVLHEEEFEAVESSVHRSQVQLDVTYISFSA